MSEARTRMEIPDLAVVRDYVRHLGIRRAALRSSYVLANQLMVVSVFDCLRLDHHGWNRELLRDSGHFPSRFLDFEELASNSGELDSQAADVALAGTRRGDLCHGVFDGERLVNISLYSQQPTPLLADLQIRLETPGWYMYGAFTLPEYRGYRLHAIGILSAARDLAQRGSTELLGVCERTNYPSLVSAQRMGWQIGGWMYRIGCGGWQRIGRNAAARALGMRLEERPAA